jgi:hypothetical protein
LSDGAARAIECQPSPPAANKAHWAWRLIDSKKCWYAGDPGMAKSKLHWPANAGRATERAQRAAFTSAERTVDSGQNTAREPAQRTDLLGSTEAQSWSSPRIGLAVPASDTEWTARRTPETSETSTTSFPAAGSDVVAGERRPPAQNRASPGARPSPGVHASPPSAALIKGLLLLITVCVPSAWAFYLRRRPRLRLWRFVERQTVHVPPSAPKLRSLHNAPARRPSEHSLSRSSPRSTSSRRRRTAQDIMAWR